MPKKIILILIINLVNFTLFTQEFYNEKMNLVAIFEVGAETGALSIDLNTPLVNGPKSFVFDRQGSLYISDALKRRILKFNNNFIFEKVLPDGYAWSGIQLFITKSGEFISCGNKMFIVDNSEGNKKIFLDIPNSPYKNEIHYSSTFIYAGNYIFIYLKNNSLLIFNEPGLNSKHNVQKTKIIEKGKTQNLVNNIVAQITESENYRSFLIDDQNRIIINSQVNL